jgi:tetratricopeptide (TPR) repeat protein
MRLVAALLLTFFLPTTLVAGEVDLVSSIQRGQMALYRLDYEGAEKIFQELTVNYPNDPAGFAFLAITHWNLLLRAAGNHALDDYATPTPFTKGQTYKPIDVETKKFREANQAVIRLCDRLLEENSENVKALYFKGVAHENLAGEAVAILKSGTSAFSHGRKAKGLHEKVLELDSDFVDAKLSIAVYEFAVATLPWSFKWIAFLIGMRGDKEKALAKLQEVAEKGRYRQLDARVVMALLHSWKGDPKESIRIFKGLAEEFPENYLIDINMAAVYGVVLKDLKSSLRVYQELADNLDSKAPGLGSGEVYYRIGKTQYDLAEHSMALESLQKAQKLPQLERETRFLCSFYMAQIYERRGEWEKARKHYQKTLEYDGRMDVLKKEIKEAGKKLKQLRKKS